MLRTSALAFGLFLGTSYAAPTTYKYGANHSDLAPLAQLKNGTYVGRYSAEYDQDFFLGVPYAQPPVGNLRFRNPVSLNGSWSNERSATEYSPACYGYGSDQWNYAVSEDCLYLNIIRPAGYENQSLPVAFWIHGGGFYQGSGVDGRYNVSYMVQNSVNIGKPVIAVTINYRLATQGFLSGSEELVAEGGSNFGIRDQRLALHWIQENIEAFGGCKEKVSIWGESAGAASVGFHLTAYNGRDDHLFRGAVMQSGAAIPYSTLHEPLYNVGLYNELLNRTSCRNLACLRQISSAQLNSAINSTSASYNSTLARFAPFKDGDIIADYGSKQLEDGRYVKVPIIQGANSDEGTAFSPQGIETTDDFRAAVAAQNVSDAYVEQVLAAYPDDLSVNVVASLGDARPGLPFGAQFRRSASYFGDYSFIANRRKNCEVWAAANLTAYCYRFNAIPHGLPPAIAATHFQEVAFVFYNIQGNGYAPASAPPFAGKPQSYIDLARLMDSSWISFFHDLDPNSWKAAGYNGTEEDWATYSVSNPLDFVFDANVTSYNEPDTYRKEGMALISAQNFDIPRR